MQQPDVPPERLERSLEFETYFLSMYLVPGISHLAFSIALFYTLEQLLHRAIVSVPRRAPAKWQYPLFMPEAKDLTGWKMYECLWN